MSGQVDDVSDGPISRDEMIEMFGEPYPRAVMHLLWTVPGETTFRELRRMIRQLAKRGVQPHDVNVSPP